MRQSRLRDVCFLLALLPALSFGQYGYGRPRTRTIGPNNGSPNAPVPPVELRGKLRDIDKKKIVIDCGEDQIVTFKRSKKTKFLKGTKEIQADDFPDGAKVVIEANRAINGDYDAVNVYLGEPPAADKAPASAKPEPRANFSASAQR
jgi:hypothetical protein